MKKKKYSNTFAFKPLKITTKIQQFTTIQQ